MEIAYSFLPGCARSIMRLILVLLLFPIFNTFSQPTKLIGIVTDEQGKGIAFATVQAGAGGTITDGFGRFSMDVPEGELTIIVNALGYLQKTLLFHSESDSVVEISLREKIEELNEVIITATRTSRAIDNVPMPVKVIGSDDIGQIGSVRLDEVLREQTGLQIVSDHGSGLQMQGLNSDYILILIDGEPVIGRTAGTLDLRRLAVDNIERVEIIQGPSSSLYGSEAMAGVINIITRETDKSGLSGTAHAQLLSFGTLDAGTSAGYSGDRFSTTMLVNRLSTRGYDLNDQTVSMTAPPFQALTLNPKFSYRFSENVKFSLSGRFYE